MRLDDPDMPAVLLQPSGYTLELEPSPNELYSLYYREQFILAALHGQHPPHRLVEEADWATCLEKIPERLRSADGWFKQ
ncbi:MAG TPA: hypothetical protein VKR06_00930 [Ktedonosporobacter sp.]|nr:hypothetical protein [Ktedonosporobacter sp.]